jgi:peroxiredoxin
MKLFSSITCAWIAAGLVAVFADTPKVLPIGSPAPDFSLPDLDGKIHTLADYASAKALVIIFTCNHCPDALASAGRIEGVHRANKDKGVAVVAVNSNSNTGLRFDEMAYAPFGDSKEEMIPFAKEHGWTLPYLYDGETQAFATACGAQSTPHVFLFDAERKLRYTGRMDDAGRSKAPVDKSFVQDAIDAVLAGKEIKEPVTRSFGCSTKWLSKKDLVTKEQADWVGKPVSVLDLDEALAKKLRANGSRNLRLVNFWSTTCAPCVKEFPDFVETARRFQLRGLEFVSVSLDPKDDRAKVEAFLKKQHAAVSDTVLPSLKDQGRETSNFHWTGGNADKLAEAMDSEWTGALPHTILVAPDGKILWRHSGEIDPVEVRRQVLKALDDLGA